MITSLRNLDTFTLKHRASGYDRATRKSQITVTGETDIIGNLQPYWDGKLSGIVEKVKSFGLASDDMRTLYTKAPVKTADQFTVELADTIEVDGQEFVAMWVLPREHNNGSLRLSHREIVFARKDKEA